MLEFFYRLRNKIISFFYVYFLKKIFFLSDPEKVHDRMTKIGSTLGNYYWGRRLIQIMFSYRHQALEQEILGIKFINPLGLAAGFDKNAELTDILPAVGFGFMEIGSITGEPCEGNPKPRLWRLPKSKSLVVYYGLKNDGCESIAARLRNKDFSFPVGVSVAKTNSQATCDTANGIKDYVKAFSVMQGIGDYYTINISCPNAYGGQPFTDADQLSQLLTALDKVNCSRPVFLKLSPDLSKEEIDRIIKLAGQHRIHGFICTNLTKDRQQSRSKEKIKDTVLPPVGGLSGKIVEDLATELISYIYRQTKGRFIIIGCGGVFTAEDAYRKIKAGASLIQLITGMIYQGPQTISAINQGLVRLLRADGYGNIAEAIGQDNKL